MLKNALGTISQNMGLKVFMKTRHRLNRLLPCQIPASWLWPCCSASGERCQGARGHVTQHAGSGLGRHGQSTPSPEHTWSKLQPGSGHGKGDPPATICGQPHGLAPKLAAPPTLLPAVVLQRRLPRKVFAGGSGLPQLPLAVMLC